MTVASLAAFRPPGPLADLLLASLTALVGVALAQAYRCGIDDLKVRRRLPRVGTKGQTLDVVHEVLNPGPRLIQGLTLTERFGPLGRSALPAGGAGTFFPQIMPRMRAEARTRLFVGRRGVLALEGVTATLGDPFGLFVFERQIDLADQVLVQPRPRRAPSLRALAESVRRAAQEVAASEWMKVREWRSGDPLRSIHWRLTARRGSLVVKAFETPKGRTTEVVLDRRPSSGRRSGVAFEYAVSLAAGLSLALLEQGAELRFSAPGESGDLVLASLRGRPGCARLLEALALLMPDPLGVDGLSASDLADAVVVTSRRGRLDCGVLVVAPSLPSLPPEIRRRGRRVGSA